MYSAYCNRTTPFFAFLEGMVRMFDWGGLVELRKSRSGRDTEDDRGDDGMERPDSGLVYQGFHSIL